MSYGLGYGCRVQVVPRYWIRLISFSRIHNYYFSSLNGVYPWSYFFEHTIGVLFVACEKMLDKFFCPTKHVLYMFQLVSTILYEQFIHFEGSILPGMGYEPTHAFE